MKSKKIAFLTNLAVAYRIETYRLLQERWGESLVFVFSYGPFYDSREPRPLPLRFVVAKSVSFAAASKRAIARGINPRKIVINYDLPWLLLRIRPQILISAEMGFRTLCAVIYAVAAKASLIIYWEGTPHTERNVTLLKKLLRRLVVKYSTVFLCNGRESEAYLRSIGAQGVIVRGGLGADVDAIRQATQSVTEPTKARLRQAFAIEGFVFIFVGRMIPRKGVDYLLRALYILEREKSQGFTVLLIGDGEFREDYRKMSLSLHLTSVRWVGHIDYQTLPEFFALSDCLVLPTLEDNWSLVVLEAMAGGLAVLSSVFNGGVLELVREGDNGYSFDPTNPDDLVSKMSTMLNLGESIEGFKMKSSQLANAYSARNVAERISEALLLAQGTAQ